MKRIVVGVDGSEGGRRALAWAVEEAAAWGAPLVAIHCWSFPVMAAPTGLAPMPAVSDAEELSAGAQQVLDRVVDEVLGARTDVHVERQLIEGPAAETLLEAAKDADLLVVGSRGHGGFVGLLLGSVSQHITHHAPCPIVVVPPPKASR
jgi:nucleotide-binding universal stress UspA family protein